MLSSSSSSTNCGNLIFSAHLEYLIKLHKLWWQTYSGPQSKLLAILFSFTLTTPQTPLEKMLYNYLRLFNKNLL